MGDIFFWNNPLVEKLWVKDFIHKMADFYYITNSDMSLLVVNCDWLITQHSFLVEKCFIGAVGNSIVN